MNRAVIVTELPPFAGRKVIGANDDSVLHFKWLEGTTLNRVIVRFRLQYLARQKEFFSQLLMPLLAQVRRDDNQNPPLALCPSLRQNQACFDRFS